MAAIPNELQMISKKRQCHFCWKFWNYAGLSWQHLHGDKLFRFQESNESSLRRIQIVHSKGTFFWKSLLICLSVYEILRSMTRQIFTIKLKPHYITFLKVNKIKCNCLFNCSCCYWGKRNAYFLWVAHLSQTCLNFYLFFYRYFSVCFYAILNKCNWANTK